jgi:hypothetical protein
VLETLKAGGKKAGSMIFLHSHRLSLAHPTSDAPLSLEAPLPEHFHKSLEALRRRQLSA